MLELTVVGRLVANISLHVVTGTVLVLCVETWRLQQGLNVSMVQVPCVYQSHSDDGVTLVPLAEADSDPGNEDDWALLEITLLCHVHDKLH